MRPMRFVLGAVLSAALVTIGCSPAAAQPARPKPSAAKAPPKRAKRQPPAARLKSGYESLASSDYAAAEADFRAASVGKTRAKALTGLTEVLLITGRYTDAARTAGQAARLGKDARVEVAPLHAEALRRQGKLAEAESVLRKVEKEPAARRARLILGEILLEQGKASEAEAALMTLVEDYNADRITDTDGEGLAMVGRAAHLLRSPRDANDAFNEAERAKKGDVQTLLWRAELFLEKYDPGHAEEVTKEVLAKAPNHPDARVWLAHVRLSQALDFDAAEKEVNKALAVNPKHPGAHFVLAGIALRDMELAAADRHADAGLKHNQRNLDLLSMKAAIRFLADDKPGFEKAKKKVLSLNPRFSRMYQIIGDFADWEHRYEEIVAMMREALRIDSEDAKARAQLGLNLIRAGNDAAGVKALQQAFDRDPFNVRVFNTLNLYEKVIPRDYVSVKGKRFNIRYHKSEKKILERYIPRLLNSAWKKFVKLYGFTPKTPVGIELYAERQNFAIRTSGLPNTAIQGVCFGQTLASMSPKNETFNVGMTLWHELAHVFHIQMSNNHVPRWFTEGLAEHETLVERAEWKREQDPALFEALRVQRVPKVGSMNRAFTRAEDISDIATAYYASSKIVTMLAKQHGRPKLGRMLELWGAGKRTPEVFRDALNQTPDQVDQAFRKHAKAELAHYEKQFVPITRTGSYDDAKAAAEKAPKDAHKQTVYALAALRAGKQKEAASALAAALKIDAKFADALWIKARLAMGGRNVGEAESIVRRLVADGKDGYVVQMLLADIAESKRDQAGMKAAFQAAHRFDPSQAEPLQALVDLARKSGSTDIDSLRKLSKLEEHDPRVFRRLMKALRKQGKPKEALAVGEAAIWVDVEGLETHAELAEVLVANKMIPRAIFELETAVLCPGRPKAKAQAHARLAQVYLKVPNRKAARRHAKKAKKLDPKNALVKKLRL